MDHLQSGRFPQVDGEQLTLVGSSLGGRNPRPPAVAVNGPAVSPGQAQISDEVIEPKFAPG